MKSGNASSRTLLLLLSCLAALVLAVPSALSEPSSSSVTDNIKSLPDLAADIAVSKVGIVETGYNRGPEVSKIITRNGGQEGQSWCMYTVVDCYREASQIKGIKSPLRRTGACWDQLRAATLPGSKMKILIPSQPGGVSLNRGDIAIYSRKATNRDLIGKSFLGHTGITLKDHGSTFSAVEGNTSCDDTGSQADGDGICIKQRQERGGRMPVVAFLRYQDAVPRLAA